MIIKVELWRSVTGKLNSYRVTHDTGVRRTYKGSNVPKSVLEFMDAHTAQTKTIDGTVFLKMVFYDKVRVINKERRV